MTLPSLKLVGVAGIVVFGLLLIRHFAVRWSIGEAPEGVDQALWERAVKARRRQRAQVSP